MAKTSFEIEKEFLESFEEQHGALDRWIKMIRDKRLTKRNDVISYLKADHGFGHMNASLLAGIIMNGGQPVYADAEGLLTDQFINKEHLKPLYQSLVDLVLDHIPDTNIIVKKTYISLNSKREYAAIAIKSKEVRMAMDLEGEPTDPFTKMTGIGCMPRMSHMTKLMDTSQLGSDLVKNLRIAYERNS